MSTNLSVVGPQQTSAEALSKLFPFDERLYSLEGEELAFMKSQTGIEDEYELKKHIVAVTKEAYTVSPCTPSRMSEDILTQRCNVGTGLPVPVHPSLCLHQVSAWWISLLSHELGLIPRVLTKIQAPALAGLRAAAEAREGARGRDTPRYRLLLYVSQLPCQR